MATITTRFRFQTVSGTLKNPQSYWAGGFFVASRGFTRSHQIVWARDLLESWRCTCMDDSAMPKTLLLYLFGTRFGKRLKCSPRPKYSETSPALILFSKSHKLLSGASEAIVISRLMKKNNLFNIRSINELNSILLNNLSILRFPCFFVRPDGDRWRFR